MKKILTILTVLILLIASCSKKTKDPQAIRNQIMEYKSQIAELNKKIDELYAQLGEDTASYGDMLKVKVETAQLKPFEHYVEVTGNVDAVEDAIISPQLNGQITKIYVKEGQYVKKGQLLMQLNAEVLRKNLAQLQTNLLLADTMFEKQKKLYEEKVISEVQYLKAKNQKESLEKNIAALQSQIAMATVKAPFSGVVDRIFVKEGELAAPGKPALQLVNLSQMEATAEISEKYLPKVNIGDIVTLTFQTYPDIKLNSKISFKGNVIDPVNRTFRIKVQFKNINNKIKPNMLAVIHFKDFQADKVFVVKTEILSKDINGWYLFVVKENGEVEKRYVKIGVSDQKNTVITEGLNAGDKYIVQGFNLVKDGMKVQVVE